MYNQNIHIIINKHYNFVIADEEAPLNLSLKGRTRSHNIWSPGSLCEQEMKSVEIKPDSSVTTLVSPLQTTDSRWKWDQLNHQNSERDLQVSKAPTVGPSGEKQFTVSKMSNSKENCL